MRLIKRLFKLCDWATTSPIATTKTMIIGLLLCAFTSAAWAFEPRIKFVIASQPLNLALLQFAQQADMDVVGLSGDLSNITVAALNANLAPSLALTRLLQNTHLSFNISPLGSVTIVKKGVPTTPSRQLTPKLPPVLEEVIVSATRRSTNLQNTPIAVSAISQESISLNHIKDLRDISHLVPGLEMINTAQQAAILVQLRGVGTTNITEIADGPVAIHIDGVYSPRSQAAAGLLYDIDRVEVLRGPQGTLFGRNSSSGSINVYNHKPDLTVASADLSFASGNYHNREWRTAMNIPLSNTLGLRIAGATNQHDAYTQLLPNYSGLGPQYPAANSGLGDYDQALDLNQKGPEMADQSSWRISALWQANDQLLAQLSFEKFKDHSTGIAELDPSLVNRGIRAVVLDSPSFLKLNNDTLRAKLEYDFDGVYTLSYTLGFSDMSRQQVFDADNGRDGSFEQQRTADSRFQFLSHELQLINADTERWRWLVGAFASQEKNQIIFAVDQQNAGGGRHPIGASSWISDHGGAAVSFAIQPDRRVDSLGIFAQSSYSLNTSSRLTLGLRYTRDQKSDRGGRAINCRVTSVLGPYRETGSIGRLGPSTDNIYTDPATAAAIAAGLPHDGGSNTGIGNEACWVRQVNDFSTIWKNTSGLLRYDMDLNNNVLLYSSVSTGFKSGHIQDAGNHADPETVLNYELGFKSQLFDKNMRFNAALYLAEYDELQFSNQDRLDINGDGIADTGGSTVVRNASAATIKGLELEFDWQISPFDHIQISGALMDAQFDQFEIPDTLFGDLFNPFVSTQSSSATDPVDLSGNAPPRTPDWKFSLIYQHDFHIAAGRLSPRLLVTVSDHYFLDIYNRGSLAPGVFPHLTKGGNNLGVQKAYQSYDLSLAFEPLSKDWSVEAFIKNVSDEAIKISSGNFITENGFSATYLPPRTYGLSINYTLGN